jgi:glycosyltransferase involved in cell wall biosynthesis
MSSAVPQISICLCTFRRPELLGNLLREIAKMETGGEFNYSVVVADNDPAESARTVVAEFKKESRLEIIYVVEPRRSISFARNKSLEPARGDFVAFIDDDEYPDKRWLLSMLRTCRKYAAPGVFGPVRTAYARETPAWVRKAGFYDRPEHPTGFEMPWTECRTGNVLINRDVLMSEQPPFRTEFGAGASDIDLFRRLIEKGRRFVWCQDGVVYEILPPGRCKRRFLLRRGLLRGSISLRHGDGRAKKVMTSLVAVPVYSVALPFLQLGGHHLFMRYAVRLCDHLGRLLAVVGISAVRVRDME